MYFRKTKINIKYYFCFQNLKIWTKNGEFAAESLANFSNVSQLLDLANQNAAEFGKILIIIFKKFVDFSTKSKNNVKWTIDEWTQIQTESGDNSISNWIVWSSYLSGRFPLFLRNLLFLLFFQNRFLIG